MNLSSDPINTLENLVAKNKTKSISVYLVVVLAIMVVLALLPLITIEVSSQSRGILRSKTDAVPVASVVSGKVLLVNLQNNATITKGDTLISIAKDPIITEKQVNDTLQNINLKILQDFKNLLKGNSALQTTLVREQYYQYQSQLAPLQSKVTEAKINLDRFKSLFDKGVIAKAELEKYQFEYQFATLELQSFIKQNRANWQNQINDLDFKIKNLQGNYLKLQAEESNYYLIAPISGTIEGYIGLQPGSNIAASQPIAHISPTDDLLVECQVSPSEIGLIKLNQKVKFQLDAFNYNQWGLLTGKVIDIDKNITLQNDIAFFKVRCALDSKEMKLKSGYKTKVTKGMTLTTRYIITNRSLFDLLFDKVDDWLNPKQITN